MDTSGYFPVLGADDPLFEIAAYTQLLKAKLEGQRVDVTKTDTNWSYNGRLNVTFSDAVGEFINFGLTMSRLGGSFAISTTYITAIPGFIPAGYRPMDTVNGWALMTNSADSPLAVIWWRIQTNGDLLFRLESGSTTMATGNKLHLASNWMTP